VITQIDVKFAKILLIDRSGGQASFRRGNALWTDVLLGGLVVLTAALPILGSCDPAGSSPLNAVLFFGHITISIPLRDP
jgi:hypothetical protein